jgi:hypothetical protein
MIEIRQLTTGKVLRPVDADTLEYARLVDVSLFEADLSGAALTGADLRRADLRYARQSWILQISPVLI